MEFTRIGEVIASGPYQIRLLANHPKLYEIFKNGAKIGEAKSAEEGRRICEQDAAQ